MESSMSTTARLFRREEDGGRPKCGGGGIDENDYDQGLHIMALFVVLFQSAFSCAFPLIAKRFPALRIPPTFLFLARHFGTGVLIATAFVHLLPTAFISLLDPCLPAFWTEKYPAMPGAIAMAAVFFVTTVEMVFTRGQMKDIAAVTANAEKKKLSEKIKDKSHDFGTKLKTLTKKSTENIASDRGRPASSSSTSSEESQIGAPVDNVGGIGGVGPNGFGMVGRRRSRSLSFSKNLTAIEAEQTRRSLAAAAARRNAAPSARRSLSPHDEIEEINRRPTLPTTDTNTSALESGLEKTEDEPIDEFEAFNAMGHSHHHMGPRPHVKLVLTREQKLKRAKLQVVLLEMGILFHSIFIGMALSVTSGSGFIVLLIAIIFHQTFEGLALGSRIAVIPWSQDTWQPWLMALAYGLTTPIGQAIGLGLQKAYDPNSEVGLVLVGSMNAVSSGLLLYAGLVELLAEDFLSDESWVELRGKRRVIGAFCVLFGAAGMSLIGAWA
ncbi:Zinc/iron permease [Ascobolus immersus RN42]|uniref:Zinc/iron permease n=1 Tax=Ascobolus immersus RN42 TaxID=1160509 RepID=A0A3N4I5A6_ASCIM|nr:Zinc/iron permease [Ascobolus immersus RN42]